LGVGIQRCKDDVRARDGCTMEGAPPALLFGPANQAAAVGLALHAVGNPEGVQLALLRVCELHAPRADLGLQVNVERDWVAGSEGLL